MSNLAVRCFERDMIRKIQVPMKTAPHTLTAAERHQVLVEWNQTARDYPHDKCIHQLFEEQVARTPESVALVWRDQRLTYCELNQRANRLAHHLRALGVRPEKTVGVCLGRSPNLVVALLGILKAGGAYVPLDPDYPRERLEFMLADSRAELVIGDESFAKQSGSSGRARCVLLEAITPEYPAVNPHSQNDPADLAYVIYTSGSTGTPKGVAIEHRNTSSFLHWVRDTFSEAELTGVLAATSICFDLSIFEIFGSLSWGGRIVLVQSAVDSDVAKHWSDIKLINTVPSVMDAMLRTLPPPTTLLTINLAGEPLKSALVDALYDQWPTRRVNDLYGPTETTTYSTWTTRSRGGPTTIGRPIANTQVYILGPDMEPVPIGDVGELFIGGAGVARGYLHRPDWTAERFVPDPFNRDRHRRLYRTGDLGRWRADGTIEYLGRRDEQVKIRGFRIELGEIESVLEAHPDVEVCTAVAQRDGSSEKRLVAFLVLRAEAAASVTDLRAWLTGKLPSHLLPSRIVMLTALPLTPNGKVDRIALAHMEVDDSVEGREQTAPRTGLETSLIAIWQEVLGQERIGIHDHFLDLGGHSLLALSVIAYIRSRLGHHVPQAWLMKYPTVAELARQIESSGTDKSVAAPIRAVDRSQPLPMSFGQQRMWLLQQTLPDAATYNIPVVYRLCGPVDQARLSACLRALLARHEILRTALIQQDEALVQQVLPVESMAVPWQAVDWRQRTPTEQQHALQQETRRPFDLAQAPLWRAMWATVNADEYILALTFHHSLVDEWALRVFLRELQRLYAADGDVTVAGLPPLPVQYADFAMWQQDQLCGDLKEKQQAYWREQLRALPPALELPTYGPRPAQRSGRGGLHRFVLPAHLVTALRRLARRERVSLFTLMLATFQVWLYRYTGQQDVVVGTPASNREHTDVQSLIGFFLNTLPMRTRLTGAERFCEVLTHVEQTVLSGLEHSDLPFEELVALAACDRDAVHTPLYQVMFVLVEHGLGTWSLGPIPARGVDVHTGTSKHDLILSVTAEGDEWSCEWEYAADLFVAETATRMAAHWVELLHSLATGPDAYIGQLNLLPADERDRSLVTWNQTARDYPRDQCIHQLFEEQVEQMPQAVAIVADHRTLTYGELNDSANRLAHRLRQLGVGRETRVAVHLHRSVEFVITVLGILKAGGAYVPLGLNYPTDRLRFMLVDSGAQVIVTMGPVPAGLGRRGLVILDLAQDAASINANPSTDPAPLGTAEDLAYVMYTSGSTGWPKGVGIPHRGVVRLVRGQDYAEFDTTQRFLFLASTCFDASTFELWGPLLNGAVCVVFCPVLPDFEALAQVVRLQRITCLWLTAGLFNQIVDERPTILASVGHVLAGGDALSVRHVQRALEMFPALRLTNGYGPTEATTFSCTHPIDQNTSLATGSVPIGRPIANTCCYILDADSNPVPIGVVGELHVGGDGLARGYLNLPELTAEKFVPHPFSRETGARLYKTGDMARYLPDGTVEFLERRDQQVKIRGYRIELGEIESALETHPDVQACAVVAQTIDGDEKRLRACVVPRARAALSAQGLRSWLRERLPDYMQPARFVVMEALPLTPNGKVDRKALQNSPGSDVAAGTDHVPPRTHTEHTVALIWQEVLGLPQVGIHDNFFDLGGQSLLAVRAVSRIHRQTGVLLPLSLFFAQPTILQLARMLDQETQPSTVPSPAAIRETRTGVPLFSLGWYLDLESLELADSRHYVLPFPDFALSAEQCRVEYLAQTCLHTLRAIQPHGPYRIAGYSLAGLVAYEMACRLEADGEVVQMVGVVDTCPATRLRQAAPLAIRAVAKFSGLSFRSQLLLARGWFYVLDLVDQGWRLSLWKAVKAMGSDLQRALRLWSQPTCRSADRAAKAGADVHEGLRESSASQISFGKFWAHRWAHTLYRPRPYAGLLTLFTSEQLATQYTTPGRGWRKWARGVREYLISGTHGSCVTDHKAELAEKFKECLAELNRDQS